MTGSRVVVVGGGIAGMATAALLASRGHSVDLLEKNDELGGRVGSVERDGFRFDTGASWYLMPEVFDTCTGKQDKQRCQRSTQQVVSVHDVHSAVAALHDLVTKG